MSLPRWSGRLRSSDDNVGVSVPDVHPDAPVGAPEPLQPEIRDPVEVRGGRPAAHLGRRGRRSSMARTSRRTDADAHAWGEHEEG